jgi:photosystem II stability/assembly factor-like uncharacterized protein
MKNFILSFFLIALSTLSYPQWQMLDGPYETHGVKRLFNHPNGSLFAIGYNNLYDNNRVYRSTDLGETWEKVLSGTGQLYSLYGDSLNGVYAGGDGVIYYSSDNGENWVFKNIGQTSWAIHAISTNTLGFIFASNADGIYLSTDNGIIWSRLLNKPTGDFIILENNEIYAATTEGIYFSTNLGASWTILNNGLPSIHCRNITIDSYGNLFTLIENGIYKSTNYGLSWFLPDSSASIRSTYLYVDKNDFLYVCKWTTFGIGDRGIYRSKSNGNNWEYLGSGGTYQHHINSVLVDDQNKLYSGTDRGLYKYSESDSIWLLGTIYRDLGYIHSIVFCDEQIIFASEKLRVWKSTNLGLTWNYITDKNVSLLPQLVINGLNNRIFISPPLIFSDNCGFDWDTSTITYVNKIIAHKDDLYLGYGQSLYKSSDNGINWNLVWWYGVQGYNRVNDILLNSSDNIFISLYGELSYLAFWETLRSTDQGTSFHQVYNTKQVFAIEIDGNDNISLGTNGAGVVKSTDNGDSWIPMNSGLTNLYINDLTYSPEGILLAATNNGVFRYSEQYNYWTHLDNSGLVSKRIHNLNYHNNILYAGTDLGIAYYTGEVPVELISFTGIVSDSKVILNWSTATELNNYGFEIQRRISDNAWSTIGFVEGNGTTTTQCDYVFSEKLGDIGYVGKIGYRLKQVDFDGSISHSEIVEIDLPAMQFVLHQNYPNPFNPTTKINYSLPIKTNVSLLITDLLGREILKLVNNANQEPGNYEVEFDGTEFSSGVYFYTLITETFYQSNKMILIK